MLQEFDSVDHYVEKVGYWLFYRLFFWKGSQTCFSKNKLLLRWFWISETFCKGM